MERFVKNIMTILFAVVFIGGGFYNLGYYQARADAQKTCNVNSDTSQDVEENYTPEEEEDLNNSEGMLDFQETAPEGKDYYRLTIWKKTLIGDTDEIIDVKYDDTFIPVNSQNNDKAVRFIQYYLSHFKHEGVFTAVVTKIVGGQMIYTKSKMLNEFNNSFAL